MVNLEDEKSFNENGKNDFYRALNSDKKFIETLVENPDEIDSYVQADQLKTSDHPFDYPEGICVPEDNYDYVIITNDELRDATGFSYNWSDLISHRQRYSNLSGTIVTVEEIDACSTYWNSSSIFNDTQAHIREFCKDAYHDWGTEYVLIGGDWDSTPGNQIVPFRLFTDALETEEYDNMACDMYYSHLDGDWYDTDTGLWGGGKESGANDLYSELNVGRITVYDAQTVSNAVYKIINYDTNESLNQSLLRSAAFWGGNLGWSVTSKEYMEEIRLGTDTYRTFTGFEEWSNERPEYALDTSERLYHYDLGLGYKDYFHSSVENDVASVINHLDHTFWNVPLGMSDWDDRYNTKPFLAVSQGCLSGRFQEGDSACEQLMCEYQNRHAYALIMNTGYGYGSGISTNGATQYIISYFWDYFFNNQSQNPGNWQLGKALSYARDKIASVVESRSHAWCYSWYSIHLFGDPAQLFRLDEVTNEPVEISDEYPADESVDISPFISGLSVSISDSDSDFIDYFIHTMPNVGFSQRNNETSGVKTCSVSNLNYNTTYAWFVNATDGNNWTNKTFVFTTRETYAPSPAEDFTASAINRTAILLTWNENGNDNSYIECNANETWNRGQGMEICNDTVTNFTHTNLDFGTTYYYQIWGWNSTDNIWSNNFNSCDETTFSNGAPQFLLPEPDNESTDESLSLNWSISISDPDNDLFNWSIECSNGDAAFGYNDTDGIKTLFISNLNYDYRYYVFVNASDEYDTNNAIYIFSTINEPGANEPPIISSPSPSDDSTGVSISLNKLSILINDSDGDLFNWSITTSPDVGSSYGSNYSNGTKTCYLSALSYSTTYQWIVSVNDGSSWSNKTYSFKTRSRPTGGSSGSSSGRSSAGFVPVAIKPVADAGGPYNGTVNETVTFIGSNSKDADGKIVSYDWNFGDGSTGSGKTATCIYSSPGEYSVSLTVKDNEGFENTDTEGADFVVTENTDTTIALIEDTEIIDYSQTNASENETTLAFFTNDFDYDGIPNELEEQIGSNVDDASDVQTIIIGSTPCFLVDTDNDGNADLFVDIKNSVFSTVSKDSADNYLIDADADGVLDYKFNLQKNVMSTFVNIQAKQSSNSQMIFNYSLLVFISIIAFTLILLVYMKKRISETYSHAKQHKLPDFSKKPSVNYFSEAKKPLRQNLSFSDLDSRYKNVQSNYEAKCDSKSYNSAYTVYGNAVNEKEDFLAEIKNHINDLKESKESSTINNANVDRIVDEIILNKLKK